MIRYTFNLNTIKSIKDNKIKVYCVHPKRPSDFNQLFEASSCELIMNNVQLKFTGLTQPIQKSAPIELVVCLC